MQTKWVRSPHFNQIKNRRVRAIVIHTAECSEIRTADDNVAAWFANPASKVSAHYIVDSDSVTQCVHDEHVAWHAGPVNDWTIGIELAGKASQLATDWSDAYSLSELQLASELVAELCSRHSVPPARTPVSEIRNVGEGIYGHCDVSTAFGSKGGHWDPGPNFPWSMFLDMVRSRLTTP